jgi:hypothetical protein
MKYKSKKHNVLRAGIVTAVVAAAALILTGCLFSPPPVVPPVQPVEMTSPANVLKNVVIAYNQGDIDLYKRTLSTNFVFYFDPRDVGQPPPGKEYTIPESWSYTEDWRATNNMFNQAYSINLSIPTDRIGKPDPEETTYRADNVSISLLVMIDELDGFIADKGYCNFEFEQYTSGQGKKLWRLTNWWDRTSQST